MSEYTASNGVKVDSETQGITGRRRIVFDHGNHGNSIEMSAEEAAALIESLDHERDADLERWRDTQDPRFVVYHGGLWDGFSSAVRVMCETNGSSWMLDREDHEPGVPVGVLAIAQRFFEAHPESTPRAWASADFITWRDGAYLPQIAQKDSGTSNLGFRHAKNDGGRWYSEDELADLIGDADVTILIAEGAS